jgi:hypothetical protein
MFGKQRTPLASDSGAMRWEEVSGVMNVELQEVRARAAQVA